MIRGTMSSDIVSVQAMFTRSKASSSRSAWLAGWEKCAERLALDSSRRRPRSSSDAAFATCWRASKTSASMCGRAFLPAAVRVCRSELAAQRPDGEDALVGGVDLPPLHDLEDRVEVGRGVLRPRPGARLAGGPRTCGCPPDEIARDVGGGCDEGEVEDARVVGV